MLLVSSNMEPTCVTNQYIKATYHKAVMFTEFRFDALIDVVDLDR